ncbi:type II toxin-antitoxin system PemK/MazF family toxin [Lentibacillus cibarius]|uniref:Type II toxin-antitoxin system PemK/MazF family toxin n=1 Tax=Lentibacillus cibarius TaxID=2583219 RepID=A0A5S3QJC3_9BACI|nr:type II toxin-antitoxin system PemK/MazF family toxin [Lentibacillus cibarius]TMN21827.1 type II toxin-antitoxin system PemK/MazF family toxin [Lentibacillus cibarius]
MSSKHKRRGWLIKTEKILMDNDPDDTLNFAEWTWKKAHLRYKERDKYKDESVYFRGVYWTHLGYNVGREQDKHRPVVVVRTEKNSPVCAVVPLTTQRLNDDLWYHIDLDGFDNTALVEHFRVISKDRIDNQMRKRGKYAKVETEDMKKIKREIKRMYASGI